MDLFSDIRFVKGVGEARARLLMSLGIHTVFDMLYNFPRDYEDRSVLCDIADLKDGETVCVKAFADCAPREHQVRKGFFLYKFTVSDHTGSMEITLFNQKFAAQGIQEDREYVFYGKVSHGLYGFAMSSPEFEPAESAGENTCGIIPKYNLTAGLSRKVCSKIIKSCIQAVGELPDIFGTDFRKNHGICEINYALSNIHFPKNAEALSIAKKRIIFEELFLLSLGLMKIKNRREDYTGNAFSCTSSEEFIKKLPFALTGAQRRVIEEIGNDLKNTRVMNRLVQGDVGSGKTVIAAYSAFSANKSGFQACLMAPTEILARQHFETFSKLLPETEICLLIGKMTASKKKDALENIKTGKARIIIGTHALIEDNVEFCDLGLVITDEQHRFGVSQRAAISKKGKSPHCLVMTATPIPRTLALTLYGDLDISQIDELPPGRQEIKTYAVGEGMRERIMSFLKKELDSGRQAYIICPLVDPSDKIEAAAAVEYMKKLAQGELKDYPIGLMHGKIKDKDKIMEDFAKGETKVLISTTVVEVGVNVPNATVMIVENAERFGLSQLHQLRGRVGRGSAQSYCVLFAHGKGEVTKERMKIMCATNDGFEISQKDMELRGPGEFFGTRQHGLPELKAANLFTDMAVLQKARIAAKETLSADSDLSSPEHIYLRKKMEGFFENSGISFN